MKVVIISQTCYPNLSPRGHRTTELAKEFAKRGYDVIVYALLGNYDYTDYSNKTGITFKNLGKSKFGLTDNTGRSNKNIFYRGLRKLFGKHFEFPKIELISMVKNALKNEGVIDYLITIAQPHTIHWGATGYVKNNRDKVKFWVADCGDPFMGSPFINHPSYFEKVEREWCEACDKITVPLEDAKNAYYKEYKDKIEVIPQGFDFSNVQLSIHAQNKVPTFAYSGVFYKGLRDPSRFLKYISNINVDFKFIVYTRSSAFFEPYKVKLGERLELREYIPRTQLLKDLSEMDFLINIKNNSEVQQPSKLIDYYLTKRPILEISSAFTKNEKKIFNQFLDADYRERLAVEDIEKYNITHVIDKFIKLKKQ